MTEKTNGASPRDEMPRRAASSRFMQAEYAFARFSYTLDLEHTVDDALKPEYWAGLAHILARNPASGQPDRSGAIIELRTPDHAFYAELYVRAVRPSGLVVALVREPVSFGPKETKSDSPFTKRWNVGARGYDIIRKSDNSIVGSAKDFPIKEDAQKWIDEMGRV